MCKSFRPTAKCNVYLQHLVQSLVMDLQGRQSVLKIASAQLCICHNMGILKMLFWNLEVPGHPHRVGWLRAPPNSYIFANLAPWRHWRAPDRQIGEKKKLVSKCLKLSNSSRNSKIIFGANLATYFANLAPEGSRSARFATADYFYICMRKFCTP